LRSPVVAIIACGFSVLTVASRPSRVDDAADIRAARAQQNQAIAARDFDRVASFWMDDVQLTAGLAFTLRGREAYRRAFSLDSGVVYQREPATVEVNSHWRYSAQWLKQDGRWRIRSELFVALDCSGVACGWPPRPD
jgi:hypothetical protein